MNQLATGQDTQNGWACQLLNVEAFTTLWPKIEEQLRRVPHTWEDYTLEYFYNAAIANMIQVWIVRNPEGLTKMVFFSKISLYPAGPVLDLIWAGGNNALEYGVEVIDATLERFAQLNHCRVIALHGRPGWWSVVKDRGFKRASVVLTRQVATPERTH